MSDANEKVDIEAYLKDLIPGFLENRKADIEKISESLNNDDYETIRKIAHDMKGLGGGYGFHAISDIGLEMENAAKYQDAQGVLTQNARYKEYLNNIVINYVE